MQMTSFGSLKQAIFDKEARKQQYQSHIRGLNAYDRHKKFLNDYVGFYGREKSEQDKLPVKTDQDTLREGYRFIRTEEDDMNPSWEQRLVKRYYGKLFKDHQMYNKRTFLQMNGVQQSPNTQDFVGYCIADMSHYKTGKIGLRWRTEKEVISGKGQFVCGNKHCNEKDALSSYEMCNYRSLADLAGDKVNFSYCEAGENKQALVKLVTCKRCAEKLLYKKRKEKEQLKQKEKDNDRRKRDRSETEDDTDNEYDRKKERRKGKKASTSFTDHNGDDDENFDEYLEGMFP